MRTYHVGLIRGTGRATCWGNGHKPGTLVVQMCADKDSLSPDLWKYTGKWETTKRQWQQHKADILAMFNDLYRCEATRIIID